MCLFFFNDQVNPQGNPAAHRLPLHLSDPIRVRRQVSREDPSAEPQLTPRMVSRMQLDTLVDYSCTLWTYTRAHTHTQTRALWLQPPANIYGGTSTASVPRPPLSSFLLYFSPDYFPPAHWRLR